MNAYCGTVAELGEYLRTRRASVSPDEAGLVSTGIRRVPGLRREEVALLAGVSVDYYIRLEQGREKAPSVQVLDALGAALRLDDDGRQHLFRLAGVAPRLQTPEVPEKVDPALLQVMASWPDTAALVYNRAYDVLAANPLAEALFGDVGVMHNLMLMVFAEPRARVFYVDWQSVAANAVAGFRVGYTAAPSDPRARAVLTELLNTSEEFSELWAHHEARGKSLETKTFHHSEVGVLTVNMQTFAVRSAPGQELIVYAAEPGTPSGDALKLLGMNAAQLERRNVTR